MPRVSLVQTNLTAGEISPRLLGRTDIDRYNNAARKLVNAYPVVHGGAKRRGGTNYIKAAKYSAKKSRLIPFIYSRDVSYMLEVGDGYLRIFGAGGVDTGIEIATSWSDSMLPDVDYAQGADTMFLAHPTVPMQRLRRLTTSLFDLSAAPFTTTPFDEQGHTPAATLTLSAATVGAARTATASVASFVEADVGRTLYSDAGVATVTGYTSTTVLVVTITAAFAAVGLASGAWTLDGSPQAFLRAAATGPAGSTVDVNGAVTRAADLSLSAKTGAITITASAAIFTAGDVGKNVYADSGVATITVFTDSTHVNATTGSDFASQSYPQGGWGITASTWRSSDLGSYMRLNGGLMKITVVSANQVRVLVMLAMTSVVAAPPLAWTLESAVWSATNGYPRTLTLHEQRLVAGGSTRYPQTIWGSRIGEYLDFTKGSNDADSYSFTIAADEVNPISYLAALRNLIVHTYGGEFSMQGGVEKPITPTNVRVRPESAHGSRGVRPVTVGRESVYVQRAGRKVRTLDYRYDMDGYASPDIMVLAEHMTKPAGIAQLAYQQEPDLLLWAVREDGALLSCTLDREQSVTGWARHYTEGEFESVATIPNGDHEETWVIVRRTVNGATVRYVEIINDTWEPLLPGVAPTVFPTADDVVAPVYGYTVDCGEVFDSVPGQTVFSVPHLIGCTVDIVADGWVMPRQVVPGSGNVTISRASHRTLIGQPFKSEIGLLTPEVGTSNGTAQGSSMRTSELTLRFLDTLGATVLDGEGIEQQVPFRTVNDDVLDAPPVLFTGTMVVETLGWDRGKCEFTIVQDQPLPMHLLSVARKFTTND